MYRVRQVRLRRAVEIKAQDIVWGRKRCRRKGGEKSSGGGRKGSSIVQSCPVFQGLPLTLQGNDIGSLGTFLALGDFKLNLLAFGQGFEA